MDPYIQVMFKQNLDAPDQPVSLVIFEYNDKSLLGKPAPENPDEVGGRPFILCGQRDCDTDRRHRGTTSVTTAPYNRTCAMPHIEESLY